MANLRDVIGNGKTCHKYLWKGLITAYFYLSIMEHTMNRQEASFISDRYQFALMVTCTATLPVDGN
jgi:hypothetical protein